ncbi:hypothetical protein GCM10023156_46670 [Novipirellula rosea]|uniref:Uncharacterized protein n=1 Tax=Novipirellula rosea TaxID=1031540 RepID=A0ABP8N9A5_9BACT
MVTAWEGSVARWGNLMTIWGGQRGGRGAAAMGGKCRVVSGPKVCGLSIRWAKRLDNFNSKHLWGCLMQM